jgi:excisionase family DNA binding protein
MSGAIDLIKQARKVYRPMMSSKEACDLMGITPIILRQMAKKGCFRVFRTTGLHRRYYRDDILAFISKNTSKGGSIDKGKGKK